jgi:hypothetical protein
MCSCEALLLEEASPAKWFGTTTISAEDLVVGSGSRPTLTYEKGNSQKPHTIPVQSPRGRSVSGEHHSSAVNASELLHDGRVACVLTEVWMPRKHVFDGP